LIFSSAPAVRLLPIVLEKVAGDGSLGRGFCNGRNQHLFGGERD
jgi:hypothetical protein